MLRVSYEYIVREALFALVHFLCLNNTTPIFEKVVIAVLKGDLKSAFERQILIFVI